MKNCRGTCRHPQTEVFPKEVPPCPAVWEVMSRAVDTLGITGRHYVRIEEVVFILHCWPRSANIKESG